MSDLAVSAFLSNKIYEDHGVGDKFGSGRFVVQDVRNDLNSGYYGAIIKDTVGLEMIGNDR